MSLRGALVVVSVAAVGACRLPDDARFHCEADNTCAQKGYRCGVDGLCHPPGELGGGDAGNDGGAALDAGADAGPPPICGNVACFHFDEGDGGVTADATGHSTGVLRNSPQWVPGRVDGGLLFDGASTFVSIGNDPVLRLTGSMTLCAWVFPTGLPAGGDDAAIISKLWAGSGYQGFQLDTTVDLRPVRRIGFKLSDMGGSVIARYGDTAISENAWHHIAGVYDADGGTMTVYLNGVVDEGELAGSVPSRQQDSPVGVTFGSRAGSPGAFNFNGRIDEAMIFDRALSAEEIQAIVRAAP